MTISSTVRIAGPYIGSGAATVFPFAFKVFAAAEMQVVKLNTTSNVETILVLTTDYTVQLNGDQNSNPGGTITLPAVLASGYNLTITSDIANLQPTDLTNQGGFYPEVITDALDRATIQIQQLDQNSRAIKIPLSDGVLDMTTPVVAERASKYLAFDAAGLPVVSAGTGSDSALRTDLANASAVSAGSRLSGFRQTGTGATARTVDAKLKDTVSVKDFGAVGDGVTDDTAAIQAAINATKYAQILYFPNGIYLCTAKLTLRKGSRICGNNNAISDYRSTTKNSTKIVFNSANSLLSGFTVDQTEIESGYVWGISIKNIYIEGIGALNSKAIDALNIACSNFENIGISNFDNGIYITQGMINNFTKCSISFCVSASVYIAASTTTTQEFSNCCFRQSGWGVIIEGNATAQNFSCTFNNCIVESTTIGGINVHIGCGATFNNTYMENVPGTLFKLHLDGIAGAINYGDVVIVGGVIAGLNGSLSTNAVLIGACQQVSIIGTNFKRCTNGIVCSPSTPQSSVYVDSIEFISVTNLLVACTAKLHGKYADAVASSSKNCITDSSSFVANQYTQTEFAFQALSQTNSAGAALGTVGTSAVFTATHPSANANILFKQTYSGTVYEVGRFSTYSYFKSTNNNSYNVPNFATSPNMVGHQFVSDAAGLRTPALLVSNLSVDANSVALITTKPNITQGDHISAYRTDSNIAVFNVSANGNVTNTNNSYAAISDIKLKQDICDATPKLNDLLKVRIVNYVLKNNPLFKQLGVVAQEIESIFPGIVEETKDIQSTKKTRKIDGSEDFEEYFEEVDLGTTTKSVKYSVFVPMLIKAMQELNAKFETYVATHP